MKILWLCNARFSDTALRRSGTWLQPLAEMVNYTEDYSVTNISFGSNNSTEIEEVCGITQYALPSQGKMGFKKWFNLIGHEVRRIEEEVNPDIVHIWGTENIWGLLYKEGYIHSPAFLEMQGVPSVDYNYYGGLTLYERWKCFWAPMTFVQFPNNTLWGGFRQFKKLGARSVNIINAFKVVSVQSRWVEDHVLQICNSAKIFHTRIILRDSFYNCIPWSWKECGDSPIVFTTTSRNAPYKGIHVLLRAIGELKKRYPGIKLNIAGSLNSKKGKFFDSGYTRYLLKIIKGCGIEDNVHFLGPLQAEQIVEQLQLANVCVIPSFIESYCVALAESMIVGTPTVVSYAAAMPEFANDKIEALFYDSMDYVSCAARIEDIISSKALSERLSANGRSRKLIDCDKSEMLTIQLNNYNSISRILHS